MDGLATQTHTHTTYHMSHMTWPTQNFCSAPFIYYKKKYAAHLRLKQITAVKMQVKVQKYY